MKRIAIALCALFGLANAARASEWSRAAVIDQLQAQVSQCVAFYAYKQACGVEGDTRRRLDAVRGARSALAGAISMAPDQTALRLELALAATSSLAGDCEGLARLESRFGPDCDPLSGGRE